MNRYSLNLGGGHARLLEGPYNFPLFVAVFLVTIAVLGIFTLTWGLTTIIGVGFLIMAFVIIFLNRAQSIQPWVFLACIILGVLFIFLSYVGLELAVLDFKLIPGMEALHNFFHGV